MLFSDQFMTLLVLGAGVLLLDAGVQGNQIANQRGSILWKRSLPQQNQFGLHGDLLPGGAFGSLIGAQAWALAGWPGVCCSGIVLTVAALVVVWV